MINNYLKYIQEDSQQLNEFVIPTIILMRKLYKKYINYKQMAKYCSTVKKPVRKKCYIQYQIKQLIKVQNEIKKFKPICKKWSKNVPKCLNKADKQFEQITRKINKLKNKLNQL